MSSETVDTTVLRPYLPRLVLDWVNDEPATRWKVVDGTFVFADLSGFTSMSERLSRLGRLGAEEVTESIGTCFAELLEIVYDDGGGLVKFGGDALFLLFTGDDHVVRACPVGGRDAQPPPHRGQARDLGRQGHPADVGRCAHGSRSTASSWGARAGS